MIQMPKASQADTQARLRKENAERQAKMAEQKAKRLAAEAEKKKQVSGDRLKDIGREIKARVGKLDQLGGKTVDMIDSIDHLLAAAEKLCDPAGFTFEAFKKTYCPELGQSRTYELLAIRDGRKTLEEIHAETRKRVAKYREAAKDVTEKDSVTRQPFSSPTTETDKSVGDAAGRSAERATIDFPENGGGSQPVLRASAEAPIEEVQAGKPVQRVQGHGRVGRNPYRAARWRIRAGHRRRALRLPAHRIFGPWQEPHRLVG
jgi:hypothetical protein